MTLTASDRAWVVCHGETRLVVRGSVACPARGRVPASTCMACRHLVTSSVERARSGWCAPGDRTEPIGPPDGLSEQVDADRLAARLECAAGPGQPAVLDFLAQGAADSGRDRAPDFRDELLTGAGLAHHL